MARLSNPLAFTPGPVVFIVTSTYIAIFAVLLSIHLNVPHAPTQTPPGINITQAWLDLQHITSQFHPYNSHANDEVRVYLLHRIHNIVSSKRLGEREVHVFDDNVSNVTFSSGNTTVYFEGTNIIVAIQGSDDKETTFSELQDPAVVTRAIQNGGVLVNAHYDSVSTGYGATDDGVGVVSVLQLLSYFTELQNWPKRTVVLLLNNGEEDFLNGATAFMRHPVSQIPHTFVNLEGAGAGGRATLFRSTDTEVTQFYKATRHPFGTVVSSDGFKKGLVRSQTDYVVFNGRLGMRGLDIAFMEPRARYHTVEDSTTETSRSSLWHMLSASIATTTGLASDTTEKFSGKDSSMDGKVNAGKGTDAVWFDLFGRAFVIFRLHTLFALNVTLLVVSPLVLVAMTVGLSKANKNYLFARNYYELSGNDDHPIHLKGWRGFFRFPIAFALTTAITVALAYLLERFNPLIVYSSPFAVWTMMISAWFFFAWFFLRSASEIRPSALQRMYALIWLFIGSYMLLVLTTIAVQNYQIAGGYFATFYLAAVFCALFVSYVELYFVPNKTAFGSQLRRIQRPQSENGSNSRPPTGTTSGTLQEEQLSTNDDATETTSLLRGDHRSFRRYDGRRQSRSEANDHGEQTSLASLGQVYREEQEWSGKLPSWLWVLQFLMLTLVVLVIVGQVGLLLTSALYQTPADGSPTFFIYIAFAILTTLLIAPAGPFLHRFTYQVPTFLLLVLIGTIIYNLVAFPFSREHKLKVYFVQQVDLDSGNNNVTLTGLDTYIRQIIQELPSAQGTPLLCSVPEVISRKELSKCAWRGLPAHVVPTATPFGNATTPNQWIDLSITREKKSNNASLRVVGQNTRACRVLFNTPILNVTVQGAVSDPRFRPVGDSGSQEIRLWHREWSQPWDLSVTWSGAANASLSGRVVCLWSDANTGNIPAFDEVRHYLPAWAIATKLNDGLVEGSKRFTI